jgi:virginiamycin B lyase
MIRPRHSAALIALTTVLVACGGGGNGSPVPAAAAPTPTSAAPSNATSEPVSILLSFPVQGSGTTKRRRSFVSSATNGASVSVTDGGAPATALVDLSATSNACHTSGSTRTCSATITVPIGTDTFTITTYDSAPVAGAIPAGAHELGIGSITQAITLSSPGVSISISGLIANLGALPLFISLPSDGATHQVPIVLAPADFGNQPIVAGQTDPFANPISVTLTESGGSGHAVLDFDGRPSGTSATLAHSSDTVTVVYDGSGGPGYSVSLSASATGAPTQTTTIAPMYLAATQLTSNTITLTTSSPVTVTISESGAPSTQQYSAGLSSGCANVATITSTSGLGVSSTFTITGGTQPSLDACFVTISDGTSNLQLGVTNAPGGVTPSPTPTPTATPTPTPTPVVTPTPTPVPGSGSVQINGYTLEPTEAIPPLTAQSPIPVQIAAAPDGNMWFASDGGAVFGFANTTTNSVQDYEFNDIFAATPALAIASDGNVYYADINAGTIVQINPSTLNQAVFQATTSILPNQIVSGSDGNIYFADSLNDAIWQLSISGQFTEYVTGTNYLGMVPGPPGSNAIYAIDNTNMIQEFSLVSHSVVATSAGITAGTAVSLAVGSDGNVWITTSGTKIAKMNAALSSETDYTLAGVTGGGLGIAAGIDQAMWLAVPTQQAIVRVPFASPGTPVIYALPNPNIPWSIGIGHDGSIWYVDQNHVSVGHLLP